MGSSRGPSIRAVGLSRVLIDLFFFVSCVSSCIALYSFFVVSLFFSLWSACIFAGRLEARIFLFRVMYGFFLAFFGCVQMLQIVIDAWEGWFLPDDV